MKLSKSFETTRNDIGDYNSIEISVDYDTNEETYSIESVTAYNKRKGTVTDLTEIFYTVGAFEKIVDGIDWREVYAEEMAERENYEEVNF
jgi:hypothetical protein